jgi:hypothetical protein
VVAARVRFFFFLCGISLLGLGCAGARSTDTSEAHAPAVSVAGGDLESTPGCPPLPPISGFIRREDDGLFTDGFSAFRGTGTNLYYLQQLLTYAHQDDDAKLGAAVGEVLDDMVCLSLPVARIWGFNDGSDRSTIRNGPADFRESGLRGLDQAIWEATVSRIAATTFFRTRRSGSGGRTTWCCWRRA